MLPEKANEYVKNSLKQMLAYRNAVIFFNKININCNTLQQFSNITDFDFTDACFGAIHSPDYNNFVKKLTTTTEELLKRIICDLPDGEDKQTRKDQLEYLKNLEQYNQIDINE